jgi:archaemetzincin
MRSFLIFFLFSVIFCCSKKVEQSKTIAVLPYEGFSISKAETVAKTIANFYKIKTIVLPQIDLPKSAFVAIKYPRYRDDSIIRIQNRSIPDTIDFIVGLTNKDVSVTKKDADGKVLKPEWKYNDFGVMGLGYCPGNSCVISTFRLKNKDKNLELSRLKKVVIHEFGHNLGLPHCSDKHCVMTSAAEKISTIDNEKMELCVKCKNILELN